MACLLLVSELFDACIDWEWFLNILFCLFREVIVCFLPSCLVKTFALFQLYQANLSVYMIISEVIACLLPSCLVNTFALFQPSQANLRVYNMMITVCYNE